MDGSAFPGSRRHRRSLTLSAIVAIALAGGLYLAGQTDGDSALAQAREVGLTLLAPVRWLGSLPGRWQAHQQEKENRSDLAEALKSANSRIRQLESASLITDGLEAENRRLRHLLSMEPRVALRIHAVKVARRHVWPLEHRIVLSEGSATGVTVGAPVITPDGVLGHVESVTRGESIVVLTTELEHAVPAILERNGATTIVHGTGEPDNLRVSWLTQNVDIRVGDRLVTSGLGRRFPDGLPVAEVTQVDSIPGERFLSVSARPLAGNDRYPEVLVVEGAAPDEGIGQTAPVAH